jgi:hypothetical protein
VLRREEGDEFDPGRFVKNVDSAPAFAVYAGGVGQEPDAFTFNSVETVGGEDVDPK